MQAKTGYALDQSSIVFEKNIHLYETDGFVDQEIAHNAFFSVQHMSVAKMEAPYDTDCYDYPRIHLKNRKECLYACVNRLTIRSLNKIPFSAVVSRADRVYDLITISLNDLQINRTMAFIADELQEKCEKVCSQDDCRSAGDILDHIGYYNEGSYGNFIGTKLMYVLSKKPDITVAYSAAIELVQVIVMVLNSISFWLAICVFDALQHPFRLFDCFFHNGREIFTWLRKLRNSLVIVLVVAACSMQIHQSASSYMKYRTKTDVSITYNNERAVPTVSVCSLMETFAMMCMASYNDKAICRRLLPLDKNVSDIFSIWRSYDARNLDYNLETSHNIVTSTRTDFVIWRGFCRTVVPQKDHVLIKDPTLSSLLNIFPKIDLHMGQSTFRIVGIIIHDSKVLPHTLEMSSVFHTIENNTNQKILIEVSKFHRLLPPYDTNCRNYSVTGFDSRQHCISECVHAKYYRDTGKFPYNIAIHLSEANRGVMVKRNINPDLSKRYLFNECLQEKCKQVDCAETTFAKDIIIERSSEKDRYKIFIESSLEPTTSITSEPSYVWITFVTDIAGIIGFWTGIGPLSLLFSSVVMSVLQRFKAFNLNKYFHTVVYAFLTTLFVVQVQQFIVDYFKYQTSAQLLVGGSSDHNESMILSICRHEVNMSNSMYNIISYYRTNNFIYDSDKNDSCGGQMNLQKFVMFGMSCQSPVITRVQSNESCNLISRLTDSCLTKLTFGEHHTQVMHNTRLFITARHTDTFLYDEGNNMIPLLFNKSTSVIISYYSISHHGRLEYPYDTDCRRKQTQSSSHCVNTCYTTRYFDEYGSYPFDAPIDLSATNVKSIAGISQSSVSEHMKEECSRICKTDCDQTFYFIARKPEFMASNQSVMYFQEQKYKSKVVQYSAKITLLQLMYVLLNGASFWLCFSPQMVAGWIEWLFENARIFKRKHVVTPVLQVEVVDEHAQTNIDVDGPAAIHEIQTIEGISKESKWQLVKRHMTDIIISETFDQVVPREEERSEDPIGDTGISESRDAETMMH
jgi:hypothetical protein